MSLLLDYLNELGLNNSNDLKETLSSYGAEKLLEVVEQMRKFIEEDYIVKEHTPFTFVPNDDLTGAGGCSALDCKIKRANKFAIFSSLYADDVYMNLSYITSPHFPIYSLDSIKSNKKNARNRFYYSIHCDIEIINTYSELINAGIVHITPPQKSYCKNCFQKALLGIEQPISIDSIKNDYVEKSQFIVHDYNSSKSYLSFILQNVDEFFPEHSMIFTLYNLEKIPEVMRKKGLEITIPEFKVDFIDGFIDKEFFNACYYASYCKEQNAKLITNKLSDGMFFGLTKENMYDKSLRQAQNLVPQYDMPFVTNLQISDVLKLRELENESFNKYRLALNNAAIEQVKTSNITDWTQIYDQVLYPAFNDLDLKLKQIKDGVFKRTFGTMGILGTVILAGTYTGIIPANYSAIFSSIGLPLTAMGGNYILDKGSTKKAELLNNDYYFLWRLKKENKITI